MAGDTAKRSSNKPSPESSGIYDSIQRFWTKSYAGDYTGLILLLAAYLLIQFFGEPFHRLFRLDDPRLGFPHAEVERVSVSYLFLYAGLLPLLTLIAWALIFRPSAHKAHVTILGLFITIFLTCFITDVIKDAVGRPRPDLVARCKADLTAPLHELVSVDVCTETNHHVLHDGWRSFPSGHSSFAFAGLGYLAMFFGSQTHVLRARADLAVVLLCLAPLLGAGLIAMSRLEDYRHDYADVLFGSLIGFSVAYFNWRRYYPSLMSRGCDEPHAGPGSRTGSPSGGEGGFRRVRDEEEGFVAEAGRFSIGDDEVEAFERSRSR
ncbi:hypothetical protein LTR62_003434 [Meristemomyces frigidus]|uniref:Phosphatidic acid phosphatase type 2/haloperoxidase domain-containing protein n=1 Tax=Meristemomyces frigidus TaxID=1508187 RepID=A0AAN7YKL0_9PEZI|nr:hypothetical protein LTR62_003434 [Meristemomyces frigidus]